MTEIQSKASEKPVKYFPIFDFKKRKENGLQEAGKVTSLGLKSEKIKKKVNKKKRLPLLNSNFQYAIDAGQKEFDASRCKTCNMLYTKGEYFDEGHHRQYHDMFVNSIKFSGWKNERIVRYFESGAKIIAVKPSDPKYMLRKIDDLFSIADLELGIGQNVYSSLKPTSIFLIYVTVDKRIGGFVSAHEIDKANEVINDEGLVDESKSLPAEIGITRLWVHSNYRRMKIASEMLDTLRARFIPNRIIPKSGIAFTDPTDDGKKFVQNYTGNSNLLVFQIY